MMVLARSLVRRPAYSFLSIALLGLGIGAVSTPSMLVAQSAWRGLRPLAIGVGVGALVAIPVLSLMQRTLDHSLSVEDAPLLVSVVLALGVTAMIAAAIPARRATRVSPLEAMRQ